MVRVVTAIEVVAIEEPRYIGCDVDYGPGARAIKHIGPGYRHWLPGLEPLTTHDYAEHMWTTRCDENTTGMIVEITTADRVTCPECQAHLAADYLELEPPDGCD